jgi:hypothetical protein
VQFRDLAPSRPPSDMYGGGALVASILPGTGAPIFIDANAARFTGARRKVGNDHGDVADLRDDRILHITFALAKAGRMKMQVGDDTSAAFATMLPETAETTIPVLREFGSTLS